MIRSDRPITSYSDLELADHFDDAQDELARVVDNGMDTTEAMMMAGAIATEMALRYHRYVRSASRV